MFHKTRCYNGGNQHKFEARYDEEPTYENGLKEIKIDKLDWSRRRHQSAPGSGPDWFSYPDHFADIRKMLHKKVYLYDICVWCGKIKVHGKDKIDKHLKAMGLMHENGELNLGVEE